MAAAVADDAREVPGTRRRIRGAGAGARHDLSRAGEDRADAHREAGRRTASTRRSCVVRRLFRPAAAFRSRLELPPARCRGAARAAAIAGKGRGPSGADHPRARPRRDEGRAPGARTAHPLSAAQRRQASGRHDPWLQRQRDDLRASGGRSQSRAVFLGPQARRLDSRLDGRQPCRQRADHRSGRGDPGTRRRRCGRRARGVTRGLRPGLPVAAPRRAPGVRRAAR